jgi:hypothetical protein
MVRVHRAPKGPRERGDTGRESGDLAFFGGIWKVTGKKEEE